MKVANEQRRIEELITRAGRAGGQVRWAVDLVSPMASLLLAVLLTSGQDVVYVPGRMVSALAGALGGEGKTDAKDARVIADIARMRRDLAPITPSDELVVELARLTSHRADLMADWVRGVNRLRDLLGSIFPALESSFDYSTRSALILVTGFCTPAEVRQAGQDGLTAAVARQGLRRQAAPRRATFPGRSAVTGSSWRRAESAHSHAGSHQDRRPAPARRAPRALDVHPRVAMQILRHSKISITMEIYTEVPDASTREALRRLGETLG